MSKKPSGQQDDVSADFGETPISSAVPLKRQIVQKAAAPEKTPTEGKSAPTSLPSCSTSKKND